MNLTITTTSTNLIQAAAEALHLPVDQILRASLLPDGRTIKVVEAFPDHRVFYLKLSDIPQDWGAGGQEPIQPSPPKAKPTLTPALTPALTKEGKEGTPGKPTPKKRGRPKP